ncbi:SDR family NAD(P)-dependent oxidoreductase [Altererythrobacter xixiisoli]|uniref:SDR family NAD(P)-dependent oxidoreductase n=1 Tax=Croceibacterium xixiisoli TaxID=1476466 RepID=A0A6I4TT48_9SPHN|nr:SDR family NAD(P)-dependent oxidoreductase [Croceibacterium xixiisoli]MXO98301.1 SDR family NAD(P)-dependent oxidoreductase [Croceibacterium xixiisoli]
MDDLNGKVAFITGGASGIGLGMARAFLEQGMKVSLADWNEKHIDQARDLLAGNNAVHFVKANVADRDNLRAAVEETLAAFGKIHVLCNNAGVNGGGTAASEDFGDWDRALAVNLGGVVNGTKIVAPIIRAQGEGGHIVNTSSMAGVVPLPGLAAYSTAKYAVRGFSESLRIQLAPKGIGVSCLFPGATRTALVPLPEDDPENIREEGAPQFLKDLWDAMRAAIDPLETGRMVVDAILANRFYIFTNNEFLDEVKQRHREIEEAFPQEVAPAGRLKFENMRAEMVRDLMAPGNRPVPLESAEDMALDLGSQSPAGGQ